MSSSLVSFYTEDNLELQGYLSENPEKDKGIVLHTHGLGSNFYKNSFIPVMAKSYNNAGFSFLTFNNRGHDFISRSKDVKQTRIWSGYVFEDFSSAYLDYLAAYDFAIKNGWKKIYLQGHSSSTQKIVYTLNKKQIALEGIILISPCDDLDLLAKRIDAKNLAKLRLKYQKLPDNKIVQEKLLGNNLFTKKSFMSHFGVKSKFNIFHYHQPKELFMELQSVVVPTIVIFGENDCVDNLEKVKEILTKNISGGVTFKIIPAATHNYYKKEEELVNEIVSWLNVDKKMPSHLD